MSRRWWIVFSHRVDSLLHYQCCFISNIFGPFFLHGVSWWWEALCFISEMWSSMCRLAPELSCRSRGRDAWMGSGGCPLACQRWLCRKLCEWPNPLQKYNRTQSRVPSSRLALLRGSTTAAANLSRRAPLNLSKILLPHCTHVAQHGTWAACKQQYIVK